jgi:DNA-binding transcriptional MerR regulator
VDGYLRIGEVARRTGVAEATLRAWERRYGVLRPGRSSGGFRLYSEEDVARVRAMQEQLDRGLAASEAARISLRTPPAAATPPATDVREALADAIAALDDVATQAALDRSFATLTLGAAIEEVVLPVMREVGDGWEDDDAVIAREHFATNLVRGRLLGLARGWDLGSGPRALLACAPEELHDLALIAFGLGLRARGWRVTYLGPSTPVGTLAEAARLTSPDLVAVSASRPELLTEHAPALRRIAAATALVVGGPGATADAAKRVGARVLEGDPFAAAALVG